MKKVKLLKLIEIIKASAKAKVIAGVVGVAVVGGVATGGVAIYKHVTNNDSKPIVESNVDVFGKENAKEFEEDNQGHASNEADQNPFWVFFKVIWELWVYLKQA